jgi:hypothetical protein
LVHCSAAHFAATSRQVLLHWSSNVQYHQQLLSYSLLLQLCGTPALPHILLLYLVARCSCSGRALCSTTSSWLLLLISWRALLAGGGCSTAWVAGRLWLLLWLAGAAQNCEKWCCCALS